MEKKSALLPLNSSVINHVHPRWLHEDPAVSVLQFFFEKIEKISTLRPINKNFVNQVRGSELRNLYGKMEQVVSTIKLFRPSPYVTLISVSMYHAFTNLSVTLAPPPPPPPLTHS